MKEMSNLLKKELPDISNGKMVEFIAVVGGWKKLEVPTMSSDLKCMICNNSEHYAVMADPSKGAAKVWICANGQCVTKSIPPHHKLRDVA